jgi:hypothetical protein
MHHLKVLKVCICFISVLIHQKIEEVFCFLLFSIYLWTVMFLHQYGSNTGTKMHDGGCSVASLSHVELSKWCCYRAITCNHGNFRDVYGNFLQVKSIRLQSKISVTKGEAYGLYYAIKQIHELNTDNIILELDFTIVDDHVNSTSHDTWFIWVELYLQTLW